MTLATKLIEIGSTVKNESERPKAMSKATFRKSDLKRAILAAESAGMKIGYFEIDGTGKISVFSANSAEGAAAGEWTDEIYERRAQEERTNVSVFPARPPF